MNFLKVFLASASIVLLSSCDSNDVSLSFNTQNVPVQKFSMEASLNVFAPQDSLNVTPESMSTHVLAKSTLTKTVSFDNGSARFEMKIDSVDYKSDKRSVEDFRYVEKYLLTQHFQFKMASDGAVSDPAVDDAALQPGTEELNLMKLFMKIQPLLPGGNVKVGDTWERPVEVPYDGKVTTVYKSFKLDEVYLHDGVQMAKIGMNVKYKEVPDSTSDVRMESDGFVVGSGSILFDITHGVLVSSNLELSGHLNIHDIMAGQVLPNMHVIQKIKLWSDVE